MVLCYYGFVIKLTAEVIVADIFELQVTKIKVWDCRPTSFIQAT